MCHALPRCVTSLLLCELTSLHINLKEQLIQKCLSQSFSTHPHAGGKSGEISSALNIFGASQQDSIAAFSQIIEVDGVWFENVKKTTKKLRDPKLI